MSSVNSINPEFLNLYKAYLEDLSKLGGRHETLRTFYLSVISALFVFLSLAGETGSLLAVRDDVHRAVGWVGILICASWFFHMRTFGTYFTAKRETLRKLEESMDVRPFTFELGVPRRKMSYRLTSIDQWVAGFFGALFVYLLLLT